MFSLFQKPLKVGTPAPDFTLPDQDGRSVSLSSLRGKNVILVFYPGDETTVCRKQLCEFRDKAQLTESNDALVFGINPQSAKSHAGFRNKRNLPFPLLVDRGRHVATLYHANGIIIRRTVYLIGKDGLIRYAMRGKPTPAEVLAHAQN